MTPLAKATLQASIGALIGNRSIKYALGGGIASVNKVDCLAVGVGAVTPVMLSHIFKKSLSSITGFHGITGCAIAGALTYLLHTKKDNTMLTNTHNKKDDIKQNHIIQSINNLFQNILKQPKKNSIEQSVTSENIIPQEDKDKIEQAEKQEKWKLNKKKIGSMLYPALAKHKNLQKNTQKSYADFGEKIDENIKSIQDKILTLLAKCSPENVKPFQKQVAEKLLPVKDAYGIALKYAYEKNIRIPLNEINNIYNQSQELKKSIEVYENNVRFDPALWAKSDRDKNRNASNKMTEAMLSIRKNSEKLRSEKDNSENPLQGMIKTISPIITDYAEQQYSEALLKNVTYVVGDIVSNHFSSDEKYNILHTIIKTFPLSELEKFRDFSYDTIAKSQDLQHADNGDTLSLDQWEEKTKDRLSDAVIGNIEQSETPLEKAEKILEYLLREQTLYNISATRKRRGQYAQEQAIKREMVEPITMSAAQKQLNELKTLYPKAINKGQAEAELEELKYVLNQPVEKQSKEELEKWLLSQIRKGYDPVKQLEDLNKRLKRL